MDTIIQIVKTEWTKKSRGYPGAALRNAVPDVLPLIIPTVNGVTLQQATYSEQRQFKEPRITEPKLINCDQARELRLELGERSESLEVKFWGTPIRPSYGKAKPIATLAVNSWLQIIGNARIAYEDTTGYQKYVYNIFYGESAKANDIVSGAKPVRVYNDEVHLY